MAKIEWVDVMEELPVYGPERPWFCHDGLESHTWDLTIDEGTPVLICHDCDACSWGIGEWVAEDPELLQMDPLPVKLKFWVDGQADSTYTWLDIAPYIVVD